MRKRRSDRAALSHIDATTATRVNPGMTLSIDAADMLEELQATQQQLAHCIRRWMRVFAHLTIPGVIVDAHGCVMYTNTQMQRFLSRDDNMAGLELRQVLGLRSNSAIVRALRMARTEQMAHETITRLSPGSTDAQHIELSVLRIDAHDDVEMCFLVWCTSAAAAENSKEQCHWQRALFNSAPDLIYALNTQGEVTLANPAVYQALGQEVSHDAPHTRDLALAEWLSPMASTLLHHEVDNEIAQQGHALDIEDDFFGHPSLGRRHLQVRKFPLRDAAGKLLGIGAVARDVTESARYREQAQLSELVFNQSSDAIAILDLHGHIQRVNPAFIQLTAAEPELVIGKPLGIVQPLISSEPHTASLWDCVQQHSGWQGEMVSRALDGTPYTVRCTISPLRTDEQHVGNFALVQSQISGLSLSQAQAQRLAELDELCNLPNRRVLLDRLSQLVLYSQRRKVSFSVLFMDLDHFKFINDRYGHQVGDELLKTVAQRLRDNLRGQDTVARNGGDEFVALLPDTPRDSAVNVARKLTEAVHQSLDIAELTDYLPTISIGVATYPHDGLDVMALLHHADAAMYTHKSQHHEIATDDAL